MQHKVEFRTRAKNGVEDMIKHHKSDIFDVDEWFGDLEKNWKDWKNIKFLWKIKWIQIYRKRVWRRRIVFWNEWNIVDIFIVEIEKNTKKDYKIRMKYVIWQLSNKVSN